MPPKRTIAKYTLKVVLFMASVVIVASALYSNRMDLEWTDYISSGTALVVGLMGVFVSLRPPAPNHQLWWLLSFVVLGTASVAASVWTTGNNKRAERKRDADTQAFREELSQRDLRILNAIQNLHPREAVREVQRQIALSPLSPTVPPKPAPAAPQPLPNPTSNTPQTSAPPPVSIPEMPSASDLPIAFVGKTQIDGSKKQEGEIYVSILLSTSTRYRGTINEDRINSLIGTLQSIPGAKVFFTATGYSVSKGPIRVQFNTMRGGRGLYYFDSSKQDKAERILGGLPVDLGITRAELVNIPSGGGDQRKDFMATSGLDVEIVL
jgi:hypothetical protein